MSVEKVLAISLTNETFCFKEKKELLQDTNKKVIVEGGDDVCHKDEEA